MVAWALYGIQNTHAHIYAQLTESMDCNFWKMADFKVDEILKNLDELQKGINYETLNYAVKFILYILSRKKHK